MAYRETLAYLETCALCAEVRELEALRNGQLWRRVFPSDQDGPNHYEQDAERYRRNVVALRTFANRLTRSE